MQSFYSKQLPAPSQNASAVTCGLNDRRMFFYPIPRDNRLNHDYCSTLLSCLSPNHIVHLFEAILCSKRILLYSRYASKLTKCCLALLNLIYPFIWPYPFVSLMPSSWLQDLIDSPCPFIYGCLRETLQNTPLSLDNDIIRVDLDLNMIDDYTDHTYQIPNCIRRPFEASLEYLAKYRLVKMNSNLVNIAMSEACLNLLVELFYRLPDFFVFNKNIPKAVNEQIPTDLKPMEHDDCGTDSISFISIELEDKLEEKKNKFDYNFDIQEFVNVQPKSYISFLEGFTSGMIFLKFLDDYQRNDDTNKDVFTLFSQRLYERRQMTLRDLSIDLFLRFQQTFDMLEKHIKQVSKQTSSTFSRYLKKLF